MINNNTKSNLKIIIDANIIENLYKIKIPRIERQSFYDNMNSNKNKMIFSKFNNIEQNTTFRKKCQILSNLLFFNNMESKTKIIK